MKHPHAPILLLYFSGTGNTAFIAGQLQQALAEHGAMADAAPLETADLSAVAESRLLLFGFPVYGARMPRVLSDYIDTMPLPQTSRVIFFTTYGLYAGNALRAAAKRFARRGFLPAGAAEFKLPGSDGLAFIRKDSKAARKAAGTDFSSQPKIRENIEAIAQLSASSLTLPSVTGREAVQEFALGLSAYRRRSALIDLLLKGALAGMKGSLRRRFYADPSCIRCGTCAAVCPTAAISPPGSNPPVFGEGCMLCMRCLHQCPVEAIQIGRRTRGKFRWKGPDGSYHAPQLRPPTVETVED